MRASASYVVLFGLFGTNAMAADLPSRRPPPVIAVAAPMTWTGCYVGVFAGADFARTRTTRATATTTPAVITAGAVDVAATSTATASRFSSGTGTDADVGGRLGCNYQISWLVVGLQAEGGYLGVRSTSNDPLRLGSFTRTSGGAFGALVGRAGFAFDPLPLFLYARGGAALPDFRFARYDAFNPFGLGSSANGLIPLVGAGAEYRVTNNLSLTVDYSYLRSRCGNTITTFLAPVVVPATAGGTATVTGTSIDSSRSCIDKHMVSVGLNYYFTSSAPVPVVARY